MENWIFRHLVRAKAIRRSDGSSRTARIRRITVASEPSPPAARATGSLAQGPGFAK